MERIEIYENGRKTYHNNCIITSVNSERLGELVKVIEGGDEVARYFWNEAYAKLKNNEQQLIKVFFPDIENHRITAKTKTPRKLLDNIYGWCLARENLRETCPRCGGTGHYSYNQRDGTKCFKCWGKKYALPRLSKKWIALVQAERNKTSAE